MPRVGDSFTITLRRTHLEWGTHRYTDSRDQIYGEGFLPIPAHFARLYAIYNSNYGEGLGINEFYASSTDGIFDGVIKTSGCITQGDIYDKNIHGRGNLKALGDWFYRINAQVGDEVEIKWLSPTEVVLRHY